MKKVIKITGILACMAVLFLNVSLNHKSSTGDIDLSKLIIANKADAECYPPVWWVDGKCLVGLGECVFTDQGEPNDCDPTRL